MATRIDTYTTHPLRAAVLAGFTVSNDGRIKDPGKFEGAAVYVPHFWSSFLDGGADMERGSALGFTITPEERQAFPELKGRRTVWLVEDSNGFVDELPPAVYGGGQ